MEPEGLIRLFVLSFSVGLTLYLIERLILPRIARRDEAQASDAAPTSATPTGDDPA